MWTQSTSVTDRQTHRQTDGRTDRITITDTVQTASHGKKCAYHVTFDLDLDLEHTLDAI